MISEVFCNKFALGELAPGMMLEMDNSELLILLDSEPQLKAKAGWLAETAGLRELPCWLGG